MPHIEGALDQQPSFKLLLKWRESRSAVSDSATPWAVAHQALCPWNSRENTWVGCHSLLQGIFLTQGSNLGLLNFRQILYCLSCQGNPCRVKGCTFRDTTDSTEGVRVWHLETPREICICFICIVMVCTFKTVKFKKHKFNILFLFPWLYE